MYTIKDASERVGIPATTIRYYEKEGLLPSIKRVSGIRQFSDDDITWLSTISCFLKTGMPLATIRQIVDLSQIGDETIDARREILQHHREDLLHKIDELDHAIEVVDQKIGIYDERAAALSAKVMKKSGD